METIKYALGLGGSTTESGQEPVSGGTGPGTVEQPYDAGNAQGKSGSAPQEGLDSATAGIASLTTKESAQTNKPAPTTEDTISSELGPVTTEPSSSINPTTQRANDTPAAELDTRDTTASSKISDTPSQTLSPTDAPVRSNNETGGVESSVGADPASGQKPIQKEQGADRPLEEPAHEHVDAVLKEKTKTEETQAGEPPSDAPPSTGVSDPADQSGKPLSTINPGADKENSGIQSESKGSGTGEQYVKSTGLAADGGDFDATKPGAGREADRLLDQSGIKHNLSPTGAASEPTTEDTDTGTPGSGKKPSLGDKIKGKLHIGKK
ncbi:hypothetical protein MMC07_001275 [Pseudocyphellaria aurata]|nr:hypothetical protein [Pseudocyphellaria aurata]